MSDVKLVWGSRTDTGLRRRSNEDALIAEFPIYLVADGMGGHEAGEVASEGALGAFRPLIGRAAVTIEEVNAAFHDAVRVVGSIGAARAAAGTTISGVAVSELDGSTYWLIINIGDSRTYRLAGEVLEQISVDHSAVQELIDEGRISPADADAHPERHVITKAVGAGSRAEPDYWMLPARVGDRLLVCSDGLSKELDPSEIERALREESSPDTAATRLVHEALLRGGHDNVTVIVIDAREVRDEEYLTVPSPEPEIETVPRVARAEGGGS